jgi:phthiocerol/phenolphthiocerol synthesis type-I polyketide synthase C
LLPDEALLEGFSGPSLGLECAGIVSAVGEGVDDLRPGDRVAAVAPAALATHVVTRRNGVMRMPPSIPFAAAATMPVAFMTAVYALGHLARLQAGETVLIHGGAGGVGLAAIQYALHKGAVVYATAGSDARRQTLRMLGATEVFDSRSTSFVDDILAVTGGKGVDVVLNSVSLELMKQSLRLLRPFGRFLEIGKRDLYRDTPIGVRALRHNASYFAIDIDELVAHRPDLGLLVLKEVSELLAADALRPLPYRAYGFGDAVAAFRLLQSSGHVGKVVLLPEPTRAASKPPPFRLRDDGVTVVTGGLTGFGLETARWIARQGGRRLALLSRRGSATPDTVQTLADFARQGVDARAFACDVAEAGKLQDVLNEIRRTMGPIRGVVHAAMVLDDALLQDLDATRFATVIRGKLTGALALDRLTRADPIELFVLFSSVTTVIGTPGQASYVAANRTLEAVAERRHAAGLPALAVQWGPIADAGYLVRETRVSEMLAAMLGSAHLPAAQALEALPALLGLGRPVVGLADVSWSELRGRLAGLAGPFWSEMPVRDRGSAAGLSLSARFAQLTPEEATVAVEEVLVDEIARILQQSASTISITQPINEFGVDSLMAVELQSALEARLGQQIPLTVLTGAVTLAAIAARLVKMMDKHEAMETDDAHTLASILRHEEEAVSATADPVHQG